jgi:hypothetical protein
VVSQNNGAATHGGWPAAHKQQQQHQQQCNVGAAVGSQIDLLEQQVRPLTAAGLQQQQQQHIGAAAGSQRGISEQQARPLTTAGLQHTKSSSSSKLTKWSPRTAGAATHGGWPAACKTAAAAARRSGSRLTTCSPRTEHDKVNAFMLAG